MQSKFGHPGMPMGMADVATVLFKYHLRFNPKNPNWINRDRFILSAGHGSMLLYSLLYLTGYKSVTVEDIKISDNLILFVQATLNIKKELDRNHNRTIRSRSRKRCGNGIAEEIYRKKFGQNVINNKTSVIASDGDLMEGISHEV